MAGRVRDDVPNRRDQRSKAAASVPSAHMDFTRQLVDALQSIDQRQQPRSEQELATCAFNKLQYHLPLVTSCELRALVRVLKDSLAGKASWPAFRLTTNFIDNIAAGCTSSRPSAAAAAATPATPARTAVEHPVLSAALASAADEPPQQLQDVYQQLNGVVVFLYVAKLLALPAEHAWPFLAAYGPLSSSSNSSHVDPSGGSGTDAAVMPEAPQEQQQQQLEQALTSAMAAASLSPGSGVRSSSSSHPSRVQDKTPASEGGTAAAQEVCCEAAVMDEDGDVYEDMGLTASSSSNSSSSLARAWQQQQAAMQAMYRETAPTPPTSAAQQQQQQQEEQQVEAFPGQAEVNRRLLALLQQLCQYTFLAGDHLWQHQQQGSTGQQLLELLRLLGSSHTQQQQELAGAVPLLVGLVVDRIVAAPRDMPHLLPGCWEALGVAPSTSSGSGWVGASHASGSTRQQQAAASGACLAPEHVLALNSVLALWQQLQGPSPRAQLWALLQQHLFTSLAACCDQLAHCKASQRPRATAGGAAAANGQVSSGDSTAAAAAAAAAGPEAGAFLSEVLLVAGGVEVWVLGRPQGWDLAPSAQSSGLLRSLCQLSNRWGGHPAAEPLRRAALLLAASSQAVASWLLAVPGFVATLPTPELVTAPGSSSSSWELLHAALWRAVASCHQLMLPSAAASVTGSSSSSSSSESPGDQQLAGLLRGVVEGLGPAPDMQQLQRLHQVLHLMDAVQQAAQRPGMWTPEERRLLQQLHSHLQSAMQQQQQLQQRRRQAAEDPIAYMLDSSGGGAIDGRVESGESSSMVPKAGLDKGDAGGTAATAGAAGPGPALPLLWPSLHTLFKQLLHGAGNKKD